MTPWERSAEKRFAFHDSVMAFLILALALLPFLAKGATLWLGVSGYLLQSLYKILQLAIPAIWRWRSGKHTWNILWPFSQGAACRETRLLAIVSGLGIGGTAIAAVKLASPLLHVDPAIIRAGLDARFVATPATALGIVLFLSLLNAWVEELHFRVWLDRELSKRWGNTAGIVFSATAFGTMHVLIFWGLPGFTPVLLMLIALGLAAAGVVWSFLVRLRRGGAVAAALSHIVADALFLSWGLLWLGYF